MEGVPPHDLEAEASVLGSILINNEVLTDVLSLLDADAFYKKAHQNLFRAMVELFDRHEPVDAITLKNDLARKGILQEVGGDEAVSALAELVSTSAHAVPHARIVREKSVMRRLAAAAHGILADVHQSQEEPETLLDRAEQRLFEISKSRRGSTTVAIKDVLHDVFQRLEVTQTRGSRLLGVSTGYFELDEMLNGFQEAQLIVIAGRPSMGKTTFALNIIENVAVKQNQAALLFSLEMSQNNIAENLLCIHARTSAHKLRQGRISEEEYGRLVTAAGKVAESPIYIDDTPSGGLAQVRAKSRFEKTQHDIKLIVIDYLQMLEGSMRSRSENRQQEVSEITRGLKQMARELAVPVVVLSQLRRAAEERDGHRPRLSDLRESGAIEQDADVVMFLNREDYYDREKKPGQVEIDVAKQRNGPTGAVQLVFLKDLMRFENMSNQQKMEAREEAPF